MSGKYAGNTYHNVKGRAEGANVGTKGLRADARWFEMAQERVNGRRAERPQRGRGGEGTEGGGCGYEERPDGTSRVEREGEGSACCCAAAT